MAESTPLLERPVGDGAELSLCARYRYALWREIPPQMVEGPLLGCAEATVLFVMLNPSTATALDNDPTIRRCMGFAGRWGFGRLAVVNLYAIRSPEPRRIGEVDDPVGPENDDWIAVEATTATVAVAAWGATPFADSARIAYVADMVRRATGELLCLGATKAGHPRHPLYVPADFEPVPWPVSEGGTDA